MTAPTIASNDDHDRLLYDVREAARRLCLGRTAIYEELRSGRLRSVKRGRNRRITEGALREYVTLLEREAEEELR